MSKQFVTWHFTHQQGRAPIDIRRFSPAPRKIPPASCTNISVSYLLVVQLYHLLEHIKGKVQRDFNSVFWPIWIGLHRNINRFGFWNLLMAPGFYIWDGILGAVKDKLFRNDYFFRKFVINTRNLFRSIFLRG